MNKSRASVSFLRGKTTESATAMPRGKRFPPAYSADAGTQPWFWVTLTLSCITIVAVVFAVWELIETHFFRDLDYRTLHFLYITRGIASSLLLAFWAAWYVLRERRASEEQLRQSREHYRNLLETSPGAVILYNTELAVIEWNASAERLYGFTKAEVLGQHLATVPAERKAELHGFLSQVRQGGQVHEIETQRQNKAGTKLDVQLTLLPFRGVSGENYYLEVTNDIRERVRLRQALLQLEKLTTMGQMAAGTAHHLNTPLAAMLLRVQMMRGEAKASTPAELEQLESSIRFCQQFVRRLLDFTRHPQSEKHPESLQSTLESVVSFLSPQLQAKRAHLTLDLGSTNGDKVLADRNQIEALFIILLSNALDAIAHDGRISVSTRRAAPDLMEVAIADNGCGISPDDLPKIFRPFFSTKPPGKGTGLGLALANNILQEHGGRIWIESTPPNGTTVRVELPVWPTDTIHGGEVR